MPKFLIEANYTGEGVKGLAKDKASGRRAAIEKLLSAAGGKLDAVYYALGGADVYVIADFPDHVSAAALSFTVCASGMVRTKTIQLLTVEEMDQALGRQLTYKAPGT